jgi:hypothetical protein
LLLSELLVLDDELDGALEPDVEPLVPVVVVPVCAEAVLATPETSPTVTAPAAAAAIVPMIEARFLRSRPFMTQRWPDAGQPHVTGTSRLS